MDEQINFNDLTDEYLEFMADPENREGLFTHMALRGELPGGVNAKDPRVVKLLDELRQQAELNR